MIEKILYEIDIQYSYAKMPTLSLNTTKKYNFDDINCDHLLRKSITTHKKSENQFLIRKINLRLCVANSEPFPYRKREYMTELIVISHNSDENTVYSD